jgi:hypothetical protein
MRAELVGACGPRQRAPALREAQGGIGVASVVSPKSLYSSRRPCTHLAAFSSVDIRPGMPPSSALRSLNAANRKGT